MIHKEESWILWEGGMGDKSAQNKYQDLMTLIDAMIQANLSEKPYNEINTIIHNSLNALRLDVAFRQERQAGFDVHTHIDTWLNDWLSDKPHTRDAMSRLLNQLETDLSPSRKMTLVKKFFDASLQDTNDSTFKASEPSGAINKSRIK